MQCLMMTLLGVLEDVFNFIFYEVVHDIKTIAKTWYLIRCKLINKVRYVSGT